MHLSVAVVTTAVVAGLSLPAAVCATVIASPCLSMGARMSVIDFGDMSAPVPTSVITRL